VRIRTTLALIGTLLLIGCGVRDQVSLDASSPEFANASPDEAAAGPRFD
jgi:hypothetical protein